MHVYAPGVKGYKPLEWRSKDSTGWLFHALSLPSSKMLHLPAIQETVPVYEGRWRSRPKRSAAGANHSCTIILPCMLG